MIYRLCKKRSIAQRIYIEIVNHFYVSFQFVMLAAYSEKVIFPRILIIL